MDPNNHRVWMDFLQPLKGIKTEKKQKYQYENFDAYVCLSTDLAYLLNPKVLVDKDIVPDHVKSAKVEETAASEKDFTEEDVILVDSSGEDDSEESNASKYIEFDDEDHEQNHVDIQQAPQSSNVDKIINREKLEEKMANSDNFRCKEGAGNVFDQNEASSTEVKTEQQRNTLHSLVDENEARKPLKLVPVSSDVLSSIDTRGQQIFPKEGKQKARIRPQNKVNDKSKNARIRPQNKVNDKSKNASGWTLEMFAKYFDFGKYVRELELSNTEFDENLVNDVCSHYKQALSLKKLTLEDAQKHPLKESDVRINLDGLLMKVFSKHNIRLQTEEEFQLSSLPSGRFDYLLLTESHKPFGCIETKRPSSLDAKAFVQAVLQLCSLQQIASKNRIDIESTPVFCILTDSFRFVFIQLKGSELRLEHEVRDRLADMPWNEPQLRLRHLEADKDFISVLSRIDEVIEMTLKLIQ